MAESPAYAANALNENFLRRHPEEAARVIAQMNAGAIGELLQAQPAARRITLWEQLPSAAAAEVLADAREATAGQLLGRADAVKAARALARVPERKRRRLLQLLDAHKARELQTLVSYPEDSAGALMDVAFPHLHGEMTARETLHLLRRRRPRFAQQLYFAAGTGELRVLHIQDLALAEPRTPIGELARPAPAAVALAAGREEIVRCLETHKLADLPVADVDGNLAGVIHHYALVAAVREESSADLLTMVGASREERALSRIGFVVRKRLPWLQINLLTAFLAAAVVGLFESTIAQFTALAVLLPVVAGQSGNTGAQALAVTMRGLALREIGVSHWWRVARKEAGAGLVNGVAIALTTALGVLLWSSSPGLALVIGCAMVISMVAAGFSGVVVPVVLSALGQDPAQSSSIILTTITDVTGFFTFLGIAALLSGLL